MPHDTAVFRSRRAVEASQAHDRPVAVLPAAFAVSGGTYQRLVPCGCAWKSDKATFSMPDDH
jgi:hypothetical protein